MSGFGMKGRSVFNKQIPLIFLLTFVPLFFGSCELGSPVFSVLMGNYAYQRGEYEQATVNYLEAMEFDEHTNYIRYNLGNVYRALGEEDSALSMWSEAEESGNETINYAVAYNRGILYYELGRYEDAFEEFKQALRIDPASIPAKRNLELSLQKIQAQQNIQSSSYQPDTEKQSLDSASQRVLEYIRQERGNYWVPGKEQEESQEKDW
ncbi:MAG: tetratricopeptide repeat protein [Spirochaetales bacterium]|nr:tetratricopeptide repeat protein [Spirochaetales bacterium]MCF7938146.1 tetratricopeptide repeat protein [Spirochaetales bacterium]